MDDVDGVILLRPTVSPIIYLQQIGRALSAGSGKTPVIFDLVNNFDSLSCIDYLKKEMEEAFVLFPTTYGRGFALVSASTLQTRRRTAGCFSRNCRRI